MKARSISVDDLLRQARLAIERNDWEGVRDLAGRVRALRRLTEEKRPLTELAERLYGCNDVPVDPLSADLSECVTKAAPELTKERASALLSPLEHENSRRATHVQEQYVVHNPVAFEGYGQYFSGG